MGFWVRYESLTAVNLIWDLSVTTSRPFAFKIRSSEISSVSSNDAFLSQFGFRAISDDHLYSNQQKASTWINHIYHHHPKVSLDWQMNHEIFIHCATDINQQKWNQIVSFFKTRDKSTELCAFWVIFRHCVCISVSSLTKLFIYFYLWSLFAIFMSLFYLIKASLFHLDDEDNSRPMHFFTTLMHF